MVRREGSMLDYCVGHADEVAANRARIIREFREKRERRRGKSRLLGAVRTGDLPGDT